MTLSTAGSCYRDNQYGRLAMFFQVEVKCLEDKNIDFKYTQCVF
jgi:hypothetical protein